MSTFDFIKSAQRTINMEIAAVTAMAQRIDSSFSQACEIILACQGRTVVTGIGKSGHIAKKIAASFASTGTPAFFVHPAEASHGDLGMITSNDVVIALSNSGSSSEMVALLPTLTRVGAKIISLCGKADSPLAQAADVNLDIWIESEACPLDLAPTSSTTASLVMGDALTVALLEARGFSAEDFAFRHPGGTLGRKLLLRVSDVMHAGDQVPKIHRAASLGETLSMMTAKGFGMTAVMDDTDKLVGIFTDGDLRRCVDKGMNIGNAIVGDVMTPNPRTVQSRMLAAQALNLMETNKITALIVEDENQKAVGVLHMHDLLRAGLV